MGGLEEGWVAGVSSIKASVISVPIKERLMTEQAADGRIRGADSSQAETEEWRPIVPLSYRDNPTPECSVWSGQR